MTEDLCTDCPPVAYPTDKTRCKTCPRRPYEVFGPGGTFGGTTDGGTP